MIRQALASLASGGQAVRQAVIICGGRGLRMMPMSADRPKSLILVGGKPLLEDQINQLQKYGVKSVVLCTGHLADAIKSYFGDGDKVGVKISYSHEDTPLGKAGALKKIPFKLEDNFFVILGDIFFRMDLAKIGAFHESRHADATLVVHASSHPADSDLVDIDSGGRVVHFGRRKSHEPLAHASPLTNAGFLVLKRSFLDVIPRKKPLGFDIFSELVQKLKCYGYVTDEYIFDIGTEKRYKKLLLDYETMFKDA